MIQVEPEEQFVHEGIIPAIIDKAEFEAVNATFTKRVENGVKAKGNLIYKYTGLLKCGACGKNLVTIGQVRKNGRKKYYTCTTYHKYGKAYCSGHQISHDDLDSIIFRELEALTEVDFSKWISSTKALSISSNLTRIMKGVLWKPFCTHFCANKWVHQWFPREAEERKAALEKKEKEAYALVKSKNPEVDIEKYMDEVLATWSLMRIGPEHI